MKILDLHTVPPAEAVAAALEVLSTGGTVVYPTETCYGMGVDATNQAAVDRLYSYKTRREGKPLSVAVLDHNMAKKYVEINEIGTNLYEDYLPGPITVVSKGLHNLAKGVESEYGTLGIRIPDYPLVTELSRQFGKPFTSTSANVSYKPKPYSIESLLKHTPKKSQALIDLILDAGELPHREVSTVVDTTMNNLNIMRAGQLTLQSLIGHRKAVLAAQTNSAQQTIDFGAMTMLKYIDEPLTKPLVFMLSGELGSGKTQFAKGVGRALHVPQMIKSPTFTILDEYNYTLGKRSGQFIHVDTWRVDSVTDLESVGIQSYFKPGNVLVIEWADKFFDDIQKMARKADATIITVVATYIDEDTRDLSIFA